MNEIDFEELDRAVNSLNTQPQAVTPVATPIVTAPQTQPVQTLSVQPQAAPVSAAPAAPRPDTGRFMDMVHPSGDMRGAAVPSRPVTAPAPTIQPLPTPQPFEIPTPDAPSSPFLPDAQVEKRPLGAFATYTPTASMAESPQPVVDTSEPESVPTYESTSLNQEPTQAEIDAKTEAEQAVLPPELHSEVLDIESNEETVPGVPADQVSEVQPAISAEVAPTPVVSDPVATFGGSIPQQYTEKPAETPIETPVAPVFDAHAFTQPPKKKNSWLIVLWITLLILLGAGAGAAIYFYVLPLL